MKNNILIIIIAGLLVGGFIWWQRNQEEKNIIHSARIGNQRVTVSVASTPDELTRGLAGVNNLDWDEGKLFLFPQKRTYRFWMKGMLIPIDIIWIADNKVVDVTENVAPPANPEETKLPLYSSEQVVDKVIEVRAGFVEKFQVKTGDPVVLQ